MLAPRCRSPSGESGHNRLPNSPLYGAPKKTTRSGYAPRWAAGPAPGDTGARRLAHFSGDHDDRQNVPLGECDVHLFFGPEGQESHADKDQCAVALSSESHETPAFLTRTGATRALVRCCD